MNTPSVPVNMFRVGKRLIVVAALPGVEPEDIEVSVGHQELTIKTRMRGVNQDAKGYLAREWRIGDYEREILLPTPVDAPKTNATYGNGVLTVALCCTGQESISSPGVRLKIERIGLARGEHVGHRGQNFEPVGTHSHRYAV